jgi:hypothetical protein
MLHAGLKLGDRYRLDQRIGAGGMGEVWRAFDEVLGRVVAVKAMLPEVALEPAFARRFVAEAQAMASVNHPAVASIHDYGRSGPVTFLVMEFIEGESLSQVLARGGGPAPARTMQLIAQAAEGLQAVHERGIVHRDIKPANLMIRADGALLITDFGISRAEDATQLTVSGAVLGTPTYISPEQVLGRPATALSDVYSLGLAAYECLAGQRPFAGENPYAIALQRVRSGPPALRGDLPRAVVEVVERAIALDPADRWPSAAALAAAARAAAASLEAPATPKPDPVRGDARSVERGDRLPPALPEPPPVRPENAASPAPRGKPARRLVLAGLLVVLLAVAGLAFWGSRDPGGVAAGPPGASPDQAGSDRAAPDRASPDRLVLGAGYVTCGDGFCPVAPMCWRGLTRIGDQAMAPGRADCTEEHFWETFAVGYLPVDAAGLTPDKLISHPGVAALCSASVLASRRADGARTKGWKRTAWPMVLDGTGTWLVHCLAGPKSGETTKSVFRAG